ncbi:MAG TPA: general secretion pathway protein GspB [Xanthomonadaceae bacterium]|jgi:general secretion pathway protein B
MSLILEALRKSEAERRLGQAPDVLASMPVMHAPSAPSRRSTGAIVGVVLALSALALAGWWVLGRSHAPVAAAVAPAALPAKAAKPVAAAPTPHDEASPAPATAKPATSAPAATTIATAVPPIAMNAHGIAAPDASPTAIAPRTSPPPGMAKARDASAAALTTAAKQAASLPSFAGSPPAPAVAPSVASTSPAANEPGLLPVSNLAASERAGLPALKVTMHVYADDPAQRFMIVDGQRVGEGARLGEGIVLVRIRRDGAEIDAHGRRLLLPNP